MGLKEEQMLAVVVFKLLHYITMDWSQNRGVIFSLVAASYSVLEHTGLQYKAATSPCYPFCHVSSAYRQILSQLCAFCTIELHPPPCTYSR